MLEKSATGVKKRKIKANVVSINAFFDFNKSITPRGGTLSSLFASKTKKGFARVQIGQDLNDDGIVTRDELIYKGKSSRMLYRDELLNFSGDIKLTKSMHKCEWVSAKFPDEPILCSAEFIPTIYDVVMTSVSGKRFVMEGLGKFATPDLI